MNIFSAATILGLFASSVTGRAISSQTARHAGFLPSEKPIIFLNRDGNPILRHSRVLGRDIQSGFLGFPADYNDLPIKTDINLEGEDIIIWALKDDHVKAVTPILKDFLCRNTVYAPLFPILCHTHYTLGSHPHLLTYSTTLTQTSDEHSTANYSYSSTHSPSIQVSTVFIPKGDRYITSITVFENDGTSTTHSTTAVESTQGDGSRHLTRTRPFRTSGQTQKTIGVTSDGLSHLTSRTRQPNSTGPRRETSHMYTTSSARIMYDAKNSHSTKVDSASDSGLKTSVKVLSSASKSRKMSGTPSKHGTKSDDMTPTSKSSGNISSTTYLTASNNTTTRIHALQSASRTSKTWPIGTNPTSFRTQPHIPYATTNTSRYRMENLPKPSQTDLTPYGSHNMTELTAGRHSTPENSETHESSPWKSWNITSKQTSTTIVLPPKTICTVPQSNSASNYIKSGSYQSGNCGQRNTELDIMTNPGWPKETTGTVLPATFSSIWKREADKSSVKTMENKDSNPLKGYDQSGGLLNKGIKTEAISRRGSWGQVKDTVVEELLHYYEWLVALIDRAKQETTRMGTKFSDALGFINVLMGWDSES